MSEQVTVCKAKLSGRTNTHTATVVHRDAHGTWLFSPAGTTVTSRGGHVVWTQPADGVQFFPAAPLPRSGGWYVAWCWEVGPDPADQMWNHRWISVDLGTRPGSAPGSGPYEFVDLELDLWCGPTGLGIVDQDELDEVVAAGLVSPDEARVVERAGDELYEHLAGGYEQAFGGVGWALLDERRR